MYSYAYRLNNQPTGISFNGNTIALNYQLDRLVSSTLPNGITTDYQYNANSWLTYITTKQGTTALSDYNYGFDNIGNITTKTTEHGNYSYSYDTTYQLTNAVSPSLQESFTYDPTGNRTLDNSAPTSLTFGTTEFYYNSRNRLERVTLPDGRIATYTYDSFGRRVKKTITPPPPAGGGAGEGETYYLYSDEGLIGEYDQNGNLSKGYGWKPGSTWGTDPVFMVEGGNYYFYQNDHLGTPQKLTDINGNTVWSATYTAFGNAEVQVAAITNNLRFPGQYLDEETGLHYNWNRYYDPNIGRYTQEDPIGFGAQDSNLYRFVFGNPLKWLDPFGLKGGDSPYLPDPNRKPSGWTPEWPTGKDSRGPYSQNPDTGEKWYPHPDDQRHWDHYDDQGNKKRFPEKCEKPRPNQKRPPYGDQSGKDPWPKQEPKPVPPIPAPPSRWPPILVIVIPSYCVMPNADPGICNRPYSKPY